MDHNLKKKKRHAIALVVVMIASIVLGLIVMFVSQFGGLEALTPLHFALGFIKAGFVFFICFLYSVYTEMDAGRDRSKSGKPEAGKRQHTWWERQCSIGTDSQNMIQ